MLETDTDEWKDFLARRAEKVKPLGKNLNIFTFSQQIKLFQTFIKHKIWN